MAEVVEFFDERREHPRVQVKLGGRYLLEDGSECPGETVDISRVGLVIRGPKAGAIGEKVIAYIDDLGRIEGVIVRTFGDKFALDFRAGQNKLDRLAQKVERMAALAAEEFSDRGEMQRPARERHYAVGRY